jgi:hypothetical protein
MLHVNEESYSVVHTIVSTSGDGVDIICLFGHQCAGAFGPRDKEGQGNTNRKWRTAKQGKEAKHLLRALACTA